MADDWVLEAERQFAASQAATAPTPGGGANAMPLGGGGAAAGGYGTGMMGGGGMGGGTDMRACYTCGKTGHQKRDCPDAPPIGAIGGGGMEGYTGGGAPWRCEICGWQNKSMNKVCGGGHSKYGCGNSQRASTGSGEMVKAGDVRRHEGEDGVVTEGVGVRLFFSAAFQRFLAQFTALLRQTKGRFSADFELLLRKASNSPTESTVLVDVHQISLTFCSLLF